MLHPQYGTGYHQFALDFTPLPAILFDVEWGSDLEPEALWTDGHHEVVPNGTGYSIRHTRTGASDGVVYQSVDAARNRILREQPRT